MKYYYGNTLKEALRNSPVEIKSTKVLEQYRENYSVVIPVCEVDEEPEEEGLTRYMVSFDSDNQNLMQSFDTKQEAIQYAKEKITNLPTIIKCSQSDIDEEMGFGDDYEEEDIAMDDEELAEMLDKYIN